MDPIILRNENINSELKVNTRKDIAMLYFDLKNNNCLLFININD